jgi:Ribbon-helix-helix protein, copG family
MVKRKTTLYVDEDVLRTARVMAARRGQRDSEIFEEALRAYTGFRLLDLLTEVGRRNDLSEDAAMALANEAVHETRPA